MKKYLQNMFRCRLISISNFKVSTLNTLAFDCVIYIDGAKLKNNQTTHVEIFLTC